MRTRKKVNIDIKSKKDFFSRGKEISRLADQKKELPEEKIIWFEDARDFNKFISERKIQVLTQIRGMSYSITELAKLIGRNRTAVARDVNELELSGLVKTEMISHPGHGRYRIVKSVAKYLVLQIKI